MILPELAVQQHDASGLYEQRESILAVYAEIYADQLDDPFYSVPRYWELLEAYAARDGFSLVTGRLDDELIGYALGYPLPAQSRWWEGLRGEIDPALLAETGNRTFAVNELMVRSRWRRRGYARALHDALLRNRSEQRATLLVEPDNTPPRPPTTPGAGPNWASFNPFPTPPSSTQ